MTWPITKDRPKRADNGGMPRPFSARRLAAAVSALLVASSALVAGAPAAGAAQPDLTFEGGGWGHGIGLSQYGARGFAANGWTAEQIVTHYYQGTSVSPTASPETVRIGLQHDVGALRGSTSGGGTVSCASGGSIGFGAGGWSYLPLGNGAARFHRADGVGILDCYAAMTVSYLPGILTLNSSGDGRFASHTYRHGTLEMSVSPASNSQVRGVAVIGSEGGYPAIDVYLYGLGEMPSSWPLEALRAQAMAGRTYALDKIARLGQNREAPACNCALTSTVYDQAYVGYDKETGASGSNWVQAVRTSSTSTIKHSGSLIQAYYSSSSGGATENNELVWGGSPLPYLRGVSDPYDGTGGNPNHRWSVTFSWASLQDKLNQRSDTAVGTLQNIEIVPPLGGSGRVTPVLANGSGGVRIVGSAGTKRVSGDRLRSILGLKSTLFNITERAPGDSRSTPPGGYALRSDGGLVPFGGAPAPTGDFPITGAVARAVALGGPNGMAGYVLDGTGSLHPVNGAPPATGVPWTSDVARDLVLRPDGTSGYILDSYGGVHPFGGAPAIDPATVTFYEPGDRAKRLALRADGASGYVLEVDGQIHPFGGAPAISLGALTSGSAVGLVLRPDGNSGYVVVSDGSLRAFGGAPAISSSLAGTVGADGRGDGVSGYLVSGSGQTSAFGGAPDADSTSTSGATRTDVAHIRSLAGYILDAYGGIRPFGGAKPVTSGPYWAGWDIARRLVVGPDGNGFIMDAYGGLHGFAVANQARPRASGGPYWPGWTIARDVALRPGTSTSGYVLDAFGGVHSFGGAPKVRVSGYWSGWDIARRLALLPDGKGGYVVDGFGGIHPFAVGDNPMPAKPSVSGYWPGWDIARDITVTGPGRGYVVDGWGGVNAFGSAPKGSGSWAWPGHDAVVGAGSDLSGWMLYADSFGGVHTGPSSAAAANHPAPWPGWPIARDMAPAPSA